MLTLRFFARLREQLETSQLAWPCCDNVEALIDSLQAQRGALWGELLRGANIVIAINQVVARRGQRLCDGDEVAFFPPVTGG